MIRHLLRHGGLIKSVIEGDVKGYFGRERRRMENIWNKYGGHGKW